MKNSKLIVAYIAVPFICVFGFILMLSLINPEQGIEGYGIAMSIISAFVFFLIILLGIISLMIDIVGKQKQLPRLTWILLIVPLLTVMLLFSQDESATFLIDALLLLVCVTAVILIIKDIKKTKTGFSTQ